MQKKLPEEQTDSALIRSALNGDKKALDTLVRRHQPYIYNLAWKMVLSPADAEDITQEVLVKMITALSGFQHKSEFKTWVYRITVNHILSMKKRQMEEVVTSFDVYFDHLDQIPDKQLTPEQAIELKESVEDAKISCTAGMLLCLDREQRIIFVLGEIFGIDHNMGAEIFEISPDNFRQRLSRARKDLYNWMNNRCGLINKNNPCQCPKKVKGFIELGYVDQSSLKFNSNYENRIHEIFQRDINIECRTVEDLHRRIFLDHPFQQPQKKGENGNFADLVFFKDMNAFEAVMEAEQNSSVCMNFFGLMEMDDGDTYDIYDALAAYEPA